jgi:uncharacterized protein YjbI with pentapeptide repeats
VLLRVNALTLWDECGHINKRNYSKMKLTLTALTVAASLIASGASAFDPADLQKLKDTNECRACDLSATDLSKAYLMGANLREANLRGADLSFAKMKIVILCNTTMPDGSVIYSGC